MKIIKIVTPLLFYIEGNCVLFVKYKMITLILYELIRVLGDCEKWYQNNFKLEINRSMQKLVFNSSGLVRGGYIKSPRGGDEFLY